MDGRVYKSTGSWYKVKSSEGNFLDCCIKGKLRISGIKSTNPVVVGDIVAYHLEDTSDKVTGVITAIKNRVNYLVRKSVNLSKEKHVLASNIDCVFLVITLKNPTTTTTFIDRFLVMAQAYGLEVVLVFNKIDTYKLSFLKIIEETIALYTHIGYTCIKTSATMDHNINQLKAVIIGKTVVFSGHSGVGKSKLISAIDPSLKLKTQPLSERHKQGCHTTTFAEMFDLNFGGRVIDTPGIRGFGLVNISLDEVSNYFIDFFKLKSHCKYHNCKHIDEPHCAVKEAVSKGEIAESRYESYLQIMLNDNTQYR